MNNVERIMQFVKNDKRNDISYINGVFNFCGLKFGSENKEFAQNMVAYFNRLRETH